MRILKSVQAYYPFQEKGGPVVKVRSIALGMASRGHSVSILTPDWGFRPSLAPEMTSEKSRWGWQSRERGVESTYLPNRGSYRALTLNPSVIPFASQSVSHFDVAHVYGLYDLLGPTVSFFCRRGRIPYIVEPMGMFRPIVRNVWLKKIYHRLIGRRLLAGASLVIATSEQEKQELLDGDIPSSRIIVRRNGIAAPASLPSPGGFRAKWNIPPQARLILFLGRLVSKKSPDLLLAAFARWRAETPSASRSWLVLAGPDEHDGYSARLKSQAECAGIASSVLFTGPLYDDAKWSAYRDADVFVLPSQNENFGNSAAEAVACGTPVIVTDRCGVAPFVAQRTGLVVPHDVDALARALHLLLGDSALTAQFRGNCPSAALGLSWEKPLAQMEEVYARLLSEAPH